MRGTLATVLLYVGATVLLFHGPVVLAIARIAARLAAIGG